MRKSWLETDVIFVEFSNERSHYFSLSTPTGYLLSFVLLLPLFAAQWNKIEKNIPNLLEKKIRNVFKFPWCHFDMLEQNLFKYLGNDYIRSDTCECFRRSDFHILIEKAVLEFGLVFCYQNCSDLLWEKIVLVIEKNFEIQGWRPWIFKYLFLNFKSFSPSLEQFFLTVSQNNFGNKIPRTILKQFWECNS